MKNIMKYMLVAITALSFSVAQAGDLSVTGSAKASYVIAGSDGNAGAVSQGKGLGVSNEFTLSASGELDNGMTWAYAQDIDGATAQDDGKLTLTTSYGTLGVFISEGGLDTDNTASQSVISRPSDTSFAEGMVDSWDISGQNTLQYHTPADMLPFGVAFKVAHAPTMGASINSYEAAGKSDASGSFTAATTSTGGSIAQTADMGRSATHYQVKANPIEGLNVGADYLEYHGMDGATGQEPESGSYYLTYAFGPATIGYSKNFLATAMTTAPGDITESIEGTKYSIAVNVNDSLSISYENEESNPDNVTAATENFTMESSGIQAAYTMGGMTLGLAVNDHENASYTENKDVKDTVFSIAMAF
jgi:hypothetical protein